MFKSIVRSVVSVGAPTHFEKARLQATYKGDYEAPSEKDLQTLLKTLTGHDHETQASVAFNLIIAKLQASDSKGYWNYLIKNLIILDRLLEERAFIHNISELDLEHIENFKDNKTKMKVDTLVKEYYVYIKAKARLYADRRCSLNANKTHKKEFFQKMSILQILEDLKLLDCFIDLSFNIAKTGDEGHLKFKLNQYVFLLVLSTLVNVYSTQYMGIIVMIDRYFDCDYESAKECIGRYKRFLKNTENIIKFTNNHQYIPGFQISLTEFHNSASDAKILKSMEEYLKLIEKMNQEHEIKTIDLKINELVLESLEDDYIRLSNACDTNTLAKEIADSFNTPPLLSTVASTTVTGAGAGSGIATGKPDSIISPENITTTPSKQALVESYVEDQMITSSITKPIKENRVGTQSVPAKLRQSKTMEYDSKERMTEGRIYAGDNSDNESLLMSQVKPYNTNKLLASSPYSKFHKVHEKDELFDNWSNFYSSDFNEAFESLYKEYAASHSMNKLGNGFGEPIAIIKNQDHSINMESLFANVKDFDEKLFENFKNTYSKDYNENHSSNNIGLWHSATAIFRKS